MAAAAPPNPPPPTAGQTPNKEEDLRHLAAPMSELAAVQMEVAAAEGKCRRLQSLLRAGEREMARLQATIDDARASVSSKEVSGDRPGGLKKEPLGAEDNDGGAGATAAAAEAARRAAKGIWREVEVLDARIAVVLHALGEVERVKGGINGGCCGAGKV